MRLLCLFAIALSLTVQGAALSRQDTTGSTKAGENSAGEPSPSQSPPAASSPAPSTAPPTSSPSSPNESTPTETEPAKIPAAAPSPAETKPTPETPEKRPAVARKKRHKRKPAPSETPRKVVVRQGGAREPAEQIVPGMPPTEAARQRQNAEQWLNSTDDQLKELGKRSLNPTQQETIGQIRNYIDGARGALHEGDVRRASTLAEKAHLLSDDMVKH
jgi:hypothetical protein